MKTLAQPQGCGIGSGQSNGPTDPQQSNHETPAREPGNPAPFVWPSPSQDAAAGREIRAGLDARQRLASEVEVIWLDPTAQGLPWLREGFWQRRPKGGAVKAYTVDSGGRVVRAFLARQCDLAAYADLMRRGCGTCPIEAVDPRTIRPAVPALPAHPGLLALQGGEL